MTIQEIKKKLEGKNIFFYEEYYIGDFLVLCRECEGKKTVWQILYLLEDNYTVIEQVLSLEEAFQSVLTMLERDLEKKANFPLTNPPA